MLQAVGFYREFRRGAPPAESMLDARRPVGDPDEERLLAYLTAGHGLLDVMERQRDVLDDSEQEGTGSLLTDGVWIWREDLAHYVRKYHLRLPDTFVEHARRLEFTVPSLTAERLLALRDDALAALAL